MSAKPSLAVYWSFRSPYSYLAIDRLIRIERDFDIEVDFRPVRPLALLEPEFFTKGRKQFVPYLLKDVFREAERVGAPLTWPNPDPIQMDLETGRVAPEQPYMDRIMPLGIAACEAGAGLAFCAAAARRIWSGQSDWHADDHLTAAADEAGLSLATLDRWVDAHEAVVDEVIARNEKAQLEHHWGVPLFVLGDEPFFGQDRIDTLIWRLEGLGLKR